MNRNVTSRKGVTTISAQIEINARKEKVWEILKYPGKISDFHPLIRNSHTSSENTTGKGVKRSCELIPMGVMEEEVTEWTEGSSFTSEVKGGKMLPPYQFMRGTIKIKEMGDSTLATFTFSYCLKFGWLGRMMDLMLIRPQFKGAPVKYVEGLKAYAEGS